MQLLVTGGTGSLSKRLVLAFAARGHRVLVVGGTPYQQTRVQMVPTISDPSIDLRAIDAIVHLEGPAPAQNISVEQMQQYWASTVALLTAARRAAVPKILFVGSINKDSQHPFVRLKHRQEELIKSSGIPYVLFRAPWIIGTGDSLISPLISMLQAGKKPDMAVLNGSFLQWITQRELAEAILHWLDLRLTVSRAYDVASCEPEQWENLVSYLNRTVGQDARTVAQLPYSATQTSLLQLGLVGNPTAFRLDFGRPLLSRQKCIQAILRGQD